MATNDSYGSVLESGAVRFERLLPGPIERVWSFLTEPEKRATWFCGGGTEPRVGGHAELFFRHSLITSEAPPEEQRRMHEEGSMMGATVTAWEPPHRLAFTWQGMGDPDSDVEFVLSDEGERVRLVLTHRRLATSERMANVSSGWHLHLGLLEDRLESRPARPFWSAHPGLKAQYAERQRGAI